MVNTCSVVYCKTGYKKRENKQDTIPEKHAVFGFPDNRPDLKAKLIKFVSRKSWTPSKNAGICAKHFEDKFKKSGTRTTLKWELNPVPTIYCNIDSVPSSLLPSHANERKAPKDRSTLADQHLQFSTIDRISSFEELNEHLCPPGTNSKKMKIKQHFTN